MNACTCVKRGKTLFFVCLSVGMLKLKTPYICKMYLRSASVKDRSLCYASLHCGEYGYLKTLNIFNACKTLYRDQSLVVNHAKLCTL